MKLLDLFPQAAQEIHKRNKYEQYRDLYDDQYPLHIACHKLCDDVVLKLLDIYPDAAKIKIKKRGVGYPLHIACIGDRSDRVIMKLLDVFPEAAASKGVGDDMYPLHIAVNGIGYSKEVIQKLLEIYPMALHERSIGVDCISTLYPLGWAIQNSQSLDVIKLLVTTDPSILQQIDDIGCNYLHGACFNDNVSLVECLLQFPEILINARSTYGDTPLDYACRDGYDGREAVVALILKHPDVDVNAINDDGESALHMAIREEHFDLIPLLLNHPNIIIDQNDDKIQTVLDFINEGIIVLTNGNDDDYDKSSLPLLMDIQNLIQNFPTKRKWQSYEYFQQNFEDWSSRKKRKKSNHP